MNLFKIPLLLSYISIASVSAAVITPALPEIETTFQLPYGALEWVVSIFLLGYVVGQLIYGPIANVIGRLNALRLGLLINLFGLIICLVAAVQLSYLLLLIGRLITALGSAAGLSCTFILINEWLNPEERKRALSFTIVSFTLGSGLAVTLGGFVTQYWHWSGCFLLLFLHSLIMFALTWQLTETLKKPKPLRVMTLLLDYSSALKSKQLIIFSLIAGFSTSIIYCYSTWAPVIVQSKLDFSPSEYGYWNLITSLGMLLGGFLSAYLLKSFAPKHILRAGLITVVPCLFSLLLFSLSDHPNPFWFFATTLLLFLFNGLVFSPSIFFASNAIDDKATASSTLSFINMAMAMVSVVVMGYLPIQASLSFIATIVTLYVFVLFLSVKYLKQKRASPPC